MRRFAWVLNLDAELELARGRPGYVPPRKLMAQLAVHGEGARQLVSEHDAIVSAPFLDVARPTAAQASPNFIGRAWSPTPLALRALRDRGIEPEPHPAFETLRRVNHRRFAHELGGGLPLQRYVTDEAELMASLERAPGPWLLKRPLTFAGRGQLRIIGALSAKQASWIAASLARDGLIVEPLVEPLFEVSQHGFIWRDGTYELGRVCAQFVAPRGSFRQARLLAPGELQTSEQSALDERTNSVARALFAAGYFGPFGVDAYRYLFQGKPCFCALSEINARFTLGFAIGFSRPASELRLR